MKAEVPLLRELPFFSVKKTAACFYKQLLNVWMKLVTFYDGSTAHTATDTQCGKTFFRIAFLHFMQQGY